MTSDVPYETEGDKPLMNLIEIEIVADDTELIPSYSRPGDAAMDLRSAESLVLEPQCRALIDTGIRVKLPEGFEMQIRPRSGLAINHGIMILNSPATIDSNYTGLIKVILYNSDNLAEFIIEKGDRIAQALISMVLPIRWKQVKELESTARNENGFGSSGVK